MPSSMTGFGAAEGPVGGGRMAVELRSVNHRHFNLQARLPSAAQHLEQALRERISAQISRGHVALTVKWTEEAKHPPVIRLNLEHARSVTDALRRLRDDLGLPGEIDVGFVARQPDVMSFEPPVEASDVTPELMPLIDDALGQLTLMRRQEGSALATELQRILDAIESRLGDVVELAPTRLERERTRLRTAVAQLLDGRQADDQRLEMELALLADKLDVAEEIARLRAHLAAVGAALADTAPVGRRLAFLGQEMLREVNTIGSKANDATIAHLVIDMKADLERFREQVENVE